MLNAEGGNLFRRKDHQVREVVCGRDVKLQGKRFVIYDAERRLVESHIDMIELEEINRNRLAQVIHSVHHFVDVNVCSDADCIRPNNRLHIVPGPIKDQTVNERWVSSWPAYIFKRVPLPLIGVALVTYPVWKWPEDKHSSEVSFCEEFLVSVNQIMLTGTETEQIAAELRSNADLCIA